MVISCLWPWRCLLPGVELAGYCTPAPLLRPGKHRQASTQTVKSDNCLDSRIWRARRIPSQFLRCGHVKLLIWPLAMAARARSVVAITIPNASAFAHGLQCKQCFQRRQQVNVDCLQLGIGRFAARAVPVFHLFRCRHKLHVIIRCICVSATLAQLVAYPSRWSNTFNEHHPPTMARRQFKEHLAGHCHRLAATTSVAGSSQMATNLLLDQMACAQRYDSVASSVIAAPTPAAAFSHQVDGLPPRMPVPQAGSPIELAERRHVNGDKHRVLNIGRLVPSVLARQAPTRKAGMIASVYNFRAIARAIA